MDGFTALEEEGKVDGSVEGRDWMTKGNYLYYIYIYPHGNFTSSRQNPLHAFTKPNELFITPEYLTRKY